MERDKVTVFGGTGFLGRRVVQHLLERGLSVRIATRHPERAAALFPAVHAGIEPVHADINDDLSVANALAGAAAAVNAVSLYLERGQLTFHSIHVAGAARVAQRAEEGGLKRLIHVSGIGSDASSPSPYIRSRGEGERAVRRAFPAATLVRPSVMFGKGDAFVTPIAAVLRRLPAFPLFGSGQTRLQPVYVEDVAEAIARTVERPHAEVYELGGPRIYTSRALLETIAQSLGRKPLLIPVPVALWQTLASIGELMPGPLITRNQVELLQRDSVAAVDAPSFAALGISPAPLEEVLPHILGLTGTVP